MKSVRRMKPQNGRDHKRYSSALHTDSHNHLHLVATNKPDKVKQLKAKNRRLNKKKASARAIKNNVVDARFKLLQKALAKQTDARQNLTKPTDARNIIQERRLRSLSYDYISNASRGVFNRLGQVKIDHHGVPTVKSVLDVKTYSHRNSLRDKHSTINERRFNGVEKIGGSSTFEPDLNTFRNDRPVEGIRSIKHDPMASKSPISNNQSLKHSTQSSRVNEKSYSRSMAMYDSMLDKNLRYKELIKTPGSHLDSHQTSSINQSQFKGYKIVISNLEFSVTNEDINELFADMGVILEYGVVRPGFAEVIYEQRADAINALDVYHNRRLDGRPMKCDLVKGDGSSAEPIFGSG